MSKNTQVTIRRAALEDVPAITDIYNEAILTSAATFDIDPKTVEDRTAWFQINDDRHPILVAVVDGKVVGWASLTRWSDRRAYDDSAETTFYVHSKYRGQGIGRKLKEAIIEEARRLRFHRSSPNYRDEQREHSSNESFGFVHVGTLKEVGRKFGKLLSVHIMQKILD